MEDGADQTRIHTLRSIAQEFGRQKRSVQDWYAKALAANGVEEIGKIESNTRRFSDAEKAMLIVFASDRPTAKINTPPTARISVEAGNHQRTLEAPDPAGQLDLSQFRDPNAITLAFSDPEELAVRFSAVADFVVGQMASDLEARREALNDAEDALSQVEAKTAELKLETRLYRLETDRVTHEQNRKAASLKSALDDLTALIKPET